MVPALHGFQIVNSIYVATVEVLFSRAAASHAKFLLSIQSRNRYSGYEICSPEETVHPDKLKKWLAGQAGLYGRLSSADSFCAEMMAAQRLDGTIINDL